MPIPNARTTSAVPSLIAFSTIYLLHFINALAGSAHLPATAGEMHSGWRAGVTEVWRASDELTEKEYRNDQERRGPGVLAGLLAGVTRSNNLRRVSPRAVRGSRRSVGNECGAVHDFSRQVGAPMALPTLLVVAGASLWRT